MQLSHLLMAAAIACSALLPGVALSQEGHERPAPARQKPSSLFSASAAFAADGTLWAVNVQGQHLLLRSSKDRGKTWSEPATVNTQPEDIAAGGDAFPRLAIGPKNEIYLLWSRKFAKPHTGEIRFSRSLDGGKTFSPPLTVHGDRQEITHLYGSLAVTPQGTVYVAWIDSRERDRLGKANYSGAAIYYAVSTDQGTNFGGERRLADHSCECCRIALQAAADDSALVLWRHVFPGNVRDHALARLTIAGENPAPLQRASFDDWRIEGCPHQGPSLAVDDKGTRHAVWYTGGADAGVRYGRLLPDRVDGQRRIGGGNAVFADIATTGEQVAIVWKEFDGDSAQPQTRLLATMSRDGGVHWQQHTLAATAGANDQPRLLQQGGRFLAFWHSAEAPFATFELP